MAEIPERSRSAKTRGRILDEAQKLFAEMGYERTTVRLVAERASIHASLVMRYFGTKEGLFAAASHFDLQLPDLSAVPKSRRGKFLASYFLRRWEGPESHDDLPALLRIAVSHPDGKARLGTIMQEQLLPAVRKVVPAERAAVCAALIASQAIGLAFTRYVLVLTPVAALSHEEIIRSVGATFQRYLDQA